MSVYSSKSIRWTNGEDATSEVLEKKKSILIQISEWWKKQNNQIFSIYHVKEYKLVLKEDIFQIAWEPLEYKHLGEITISNPNIELNNDLASLHYNEQEPIKTYAIDLDIERSNLFVWFGNPQEVIIFKRL